MAGTQHTIQPGDSTTKLAFENGLFPDTVWDRSENSDLRNLRKDPNVLHPGDVLFIPDKELKEESCATEQHHKFKRKGVPEKLRVQFFDIHGKKLANKPYLLIVDGASSRGDLDGEGVLDVPIPPNAREAEVEVGTNGSLAKVVMHLGGLDPITEASGVQMRLRNLGYYKGPADGGASEELDKAVRRFRLDAGLEDKTDVDDQVRDKLKELHGA
jgi:hypothetical protein